MSGTNFDFLKPITADPNYNNLVVQNVTGYNDLMAKYAAAKAYQQSTDPTTGQVDPNKFNALVTQDPRSAWNAGPIMQQQGSAALGQAQASTEQVAGKLAQLKILSGEMSDLLQSGQPVSRDQIATRLNSLGKDGIVTPAFMNGVVADLNSQPPGADLTGWLRNHMATNLSAADMLRNVTSQPGVEDLGDRHVVYEGNPNMPGGRRVGTSYVQGQPPSVAGDLVTVNYSDGTSRQMPKAQAQALYGADYSSKIIPGTAPAQGQPATPLSGGRYVPPPTPQTPPAATAPAGGTTTPPAPATPDPPATPTQPPATTGPVVIGDSLATKGGLGGTGTVGALPNAVQYETGQGARSGAYKGQDVVLSSGASNAPGNMSNVEAQLQNLQTGGASHVSLLGVGPGVESKNPGTNAKLQALAQKYGADFVPLDPTQMSPDGVHPTQQGYATLKKQLGIGGQPTAAATPPPTTTPPPVATTAPPGGVPPPPAAPGAVPGLTIPGVSTTLEGRAKAGVEMATALHANAAASPSRLAILGDMDATNKQINTGQTADASIAWSNFVNRLPDNISSLIPGMTREQVAGAEGFAKLAETFRQMQAGGIAGTLTNDKFASALASNPHLALSTLGNQGMIHLLEGNEDAIQAKDQAWQEASAANPALDYQRWETNFNKTFDPRVYWWARMTNPEQQRLRSGMTQQQQNALATNLQRAEAAGQISRSNFNAGG